MQNEPQNIPGNSSAWLQFIRLYTFYFPIDKGKTRITNLAKKICRVLPRNVVTPTKDGRKLEVNFRDWTEDLIYFRGTYESFCTSVIKKHIKEGDVCFDVGANIGWYSTLFQKICGASGAVHSFEPMPQTFAELEKNVSLNNAVTNIFLNNFGLGSEETTAKIYLFDDLPSGHASLAAKENYSARVFPINIKTLDSYLLELNIKQVDFIKVDIEGAEMMFLHGAKRLFAQTKPPIIFMEMALETSKEFGYKPNDLINFIKSQTSYDFFAVDEIEKRITKIEGFSDNQIGANVLCLPRKC